MTNNIKIIIKSIDQSTAVLKTVEKNTSQLEQQTDKLKQSNQQVTQSFGVLKAAAMAYAAFLAGAFIKDLVSVGQQIESLQVRLNALFGSTEEGAKAFQVMTDFANSEAGNKVSMYNVQGPKTRVLDALAARAEEKKKPTKK